jgi:uncharacterized membrane protein
MNMKHIACAVALALGGAGVLAAQDSTVTPRDSTAAAAPASILTVTQAVVAKAVVDRVPQDSASTFPVDVGQLVCWSRISGGSAGTTVHHVWFHGDTQVGDAVLTIGGSPWRTWSRKAVPADATGAWHVDIQDASGRLLRRVDFAIGG